MWYDELYDDDDDIELRGVRIGDLSADKRRRLNELVEKGDVVFAALRAAENGVRVRHADHFDRTLRMINREIDSIVPPDDEELEYRRKDSERFRLQQKAAELARESRRVLAFTNRVLLFAS